MAQRTVRLKRTSLHPFEEAAGAKFTQFGSHWLVQSYGKPLEEARAVREKAALFNVTHMGRFLVSGPDATEFLDYMLTNKIADRPVGKCIYSPMCNPNGTTADDLIVYKKAENSYEVVVNAANTKKDWERFREHGKHYNVRMDDVSGKTIMLALQGPNAEKILQNLAADTDLSAIPYMRFAENVSVGGVDALVSRTGYTGRDNGFELIVDGGWEKPLWEALMGGGRDLGPTPAGLLAREIARIEAGCPLYGKELSDKISPLDVVPWTVKLEEKGIFVGKAALKDRGRKRALMGLTHERGVQAREDGTFGVFCGETPIGDTTSECRSPNINQRLYLALVDLEYATPSTEVTMVGKGGKRIESVLTKPPFMMQSGGRWVPSLPP